MDDQTTAIWVAVGVLLLFLLIVLLILVYRRHYYIAREVEYEAPSYSETTYRWAPESEPTSRSESFEE